MSNPCLKCTVDQSCCRNLHGLTVSAAEYSRLFAPHEKHLRVFKKGMLFEIWSKDGAPCPHWDGQCQIYGDRPMDCDLYPHTIGNVFEAPGEVYVTYHSRTECPLSAEIQQTDAAAEALLRDFFEANTSPGTRLSIVHDRGPIRAWHLAKRALNKAAGTSHKIELT